MVFPSKIRSGDLIEWRDPATTDVFGDPINSPNWTVIYYLRTNKSKFGASISSSAYGDGFQFNIPAATTATFVDGNWFFQAVASKTGTLISKTIGCLLYTSPSPRDRG